MIVSGFSADIYCDKYGESDGTAEPTLGRCKKIFRRCGWVIGKNTHLCPDCASKRKEKTAAEGSSTR